MPTEPTLSRATFKHLVKTLLSLIVLLNATLSVAQLPLIPYRDGDKWGYADTSGKIKIAAFTHFQPALFNDYGFALFSDQTDQYGLIDTSGKILFQPKFESLNIHYPYCILGKYPEQFDSGKVQYNRSQLFYLNGRPIFNYVFQDYIHHTDLPNRLFIIKDKNILFYEINWDAQKSRLIKLYTKAEFDGFNFNEYDIIKGFKLRFTGKDGKTYIKEYNQQGLPLKQTDVTSEPSYTVEQGYKDVGDIAPMMDPSEEASNYIIPVISKLNNQYTLYADPTYRNAKFYDQIIPLETKAAYFLCRLNQQWGLVYKNANELIKPGYDTILPCRFVTNAPMRGFGNFLSMQWLVKKDNKWGVINPENPVFNIPLKYDSIIPENYYHYLVKQNGKWGAINDTGAVEIPTVVDLSYTSVYRMPLLSMTRNIVMVGKTKNGYQLYSNLNLNDQTSYDTVHFENRFNNWYLDLERNGLQGKVIQSNGLYYVIPCKYQMVYSGAYDIQFGDLKFVFVQLPNYHVGYVRQDGKEFFKD